MLSYFHPMASGRCANLLMYTENAYSGVIQLVSLHRQFPTQFDWCLMVTSPYFTILQSCQSKHP